MAGEDSPRSLAWQMNVTVEIDPQAGFCNGVVSAIRKAEEYLGTHGRLYSLGAIVHNGSELERLEKEGLEVIDRDGFNVLHDCPVLVRAHGEPPETYRIAVHNRISLIDCTCPVVLALQRRIRESYAATHPLGGQIVIFGKREHAEVNGLAGQVGGDAIIVQSEADLDLIDYARPVELFSQTTRDPQQYVALANAIRSRKPVALHVHDTVCRQVRSRYEHLPEFAAAHSIVLFAAGSESSNGKVLFDLCRKVNPRTYLINSPMEIDPGWFKDGDSVGVSGATSTPSEQLSEVANKVSEYCVKH
jgi:4-hydroxy-3-methylbut-2-enyl diphosphate reductase